MSCGRRCCAAAPWGNQVAAGLGPAIEAEIPGVLGGGRLARPRERGAKAGRAGGQASRGRAPEETAPRRPTARPELERRARSRAASGGARGPLMGSCDSTYWIEYPPRSTPRLRRRSVQTLGCCEAAFRPQVAATQRPDLRLRRRSVQTLGCCEAAFRP